MQFWLCHVGSIRLGEFDYKDAVLPIAVFRAFGWGISSEIRGKTGRFPRGHEKCEGVAGALAGLMVPDTRGPFPPSGGSERL